MKDFLQYWPIIGAIVQAVMLWVWWSMTRKFVTVESCANCRRGCRKEVADNMEKELERMPSSKALAGLETQLEGLRGDVKAQGAELRGLSEVLERVERPLNLLLEHHLAVNRRKAS